MRITISLPFAKPEFVSQKFSFYNVEVAAVRPTVLVGGLDDDLHQTPFRVNQPRPESRTATS